MKKQFDVIPIEDYYVVVDNGIREGDFFLSEGMIFKTKVDNGHIKFSKLGVEDYKYINDLNKTKVLATLSKRIDNLPLIEIPTKKEELLFTKEDMYKAGEVAGIRAANAKNYSEFYMKQEVDKYIKSLQKKKVIKAVVLEVEYKDGWGKKLVEEAGYPKDLYQQIKITNTETNTIIPKKIFYE